VQLVRILLVDDHALVRDALGHRLMQEPGLEVVATAASADEALDVFVQAQPHIVLMDIDMPGLICFDAAKRMMAILPQVRIIFVSAYIHDQYIDQALKVGAMGYVSKREGADDVISAIRNVSEGRAHFSSDVQSRLVVDSGGTRLLNSAQSRGSTLTPRETEVIKYVAHGLAKKEIAQIMGVSVKTVDKHTSNLMEKLDIHDRVELARFAIREGLAEP